MLLKVFIVSQDNSRRHEITVSGDFLHWKSWKTSPIDLVYQLTISMSSDHVKSC